MEVRGTAQVSATASMPAQVEQKTESTKDMTSLGVQITAQEKSHTAAAAAIVVSAQQVKAATAEVETQRAILNTLRRVSEGEALERVGSPSDGAWNRQVELKRRAIKQEMRKLERSLILLKIDELRLEEEEALRRAQYHRASVLRYQALLQDQELIEQEQIKDTARLQFAWAAGAGAGTTEAQAAAREGGTQPGRSTTPVMTATVRPSTSTTTPERSFMYNG